MLTLGTISFAYRARWLRLLDEGGVPLPLDTREHTVSKPQSRDTGSHRHDWFDI